ncbi:MAG: type 2 lanthipeptide synthetase LanM, partial [Corynebacterium sp.]|uniref:type 2 lanthipeptide synthetase LanM n=1 Tax=Corynebacterium sp. TaxID=1720 RepID=UPI0026DD7E5E
RTCCPTPQPQEALVRKPQYATNNLLKSFIEKLLVELQQILLRAQLAYVESNFYSSVKEGEKPGYDEAAANLSASLHDFVSQYKVATFSAQKVANSQLSYFRELLSNLQSDRIMLEEWGISSRERIKDIKLNLGDSHSGKTVALVEFENGHRVLYKPHSLQTDVGYFRFIEILSELIGLKELKACPVIDKGKYGWAMHIGDDALTRFSNPNALGEFAAVLKTLSVSDVHFENVRFQNGIPVLVDTETILSAGMANSQFSIEPIYDFLSSLITNSGLFPSPLVIPKKGGESFIDIGVLGRRNSSTVRERQLIVHAPFTNEMRVEYADVARFLEPEPCNESIGEKLLENICNAYCNTMLSILEKREEVLSVIKLCFSSASIRVVLQDTIRYKNAMHLAFNQECLTRSDYFLGGFCRSFIGRTELDSSILRYELRAMSENNVPRFTVKVNSTEIAGDGAPLCPDFFKISPIESAQKRLSSLSFSDLLLECWLIKITFAPYYSEESNITGFVFSESVKESSDNFSKIALENGIKDLELGYFAPSNDVAPTWVGACLSSHAHQYWYVDELTPDIYAGSSGIALTLGTAAKLGITDYKAEEKVAEYFSKLYRYIERIEVESLKYLNYGAISGYQSTLWALHTYYYGIGDYHGCERLKDASARILSLSTPDLDFISGLSGVVLLSDRLGVLEETNLLKDFLNKIRGLSDQLPSWSLQTGYAHGLSGYLGVLASLSTSLPESPEINELINSMLKGLLSIRSSEHGLWNISGDFQQPGRGWCSGTPGILLALAQVHSSRYELDFNLTSIIAQLVDEVKANTFGGNPTLCHGDIGNLWVLEHIAELLKDEILEKECHMAGCSWLEESFPKYLGSLSRSSVSHSLFAGTSGACFYALHKMFPEIEIRSPLWLE